MPRMTGNRYIAKMLEAYGITSIFQVPTAFFGVMAEMEHMDIRRVVTHGEKAAAYMADGYARASRGPGICMAQSIGAANLAAGLADAFMGQSPVIAMTNAIPPSTATATSTRSTTTPPPSTPSPRPATRWTRWSASPTP